MARTLEHPSTDEISLDHVLSALADPLRRSVVDQLLRSQTEQTCNSFDLPVAKATSTHHFRVLREAGLIQQRYQGTTILNSLREDEIDGRFPGLLAGVFGAREDD